MDALVEFVLAIVALFVGAYIYGETKKKQAWAEADKFDAPEVYGSGTGFATDKDCRKGGLFGRSGIRLGFSKESGKEFRFSQDTHLTLIGPTGSAKTSSFLMPNILGLNDTSKLVTDSKGSEITLVAGAYLASLGPYYAFAPYGLGGPVPRGVTIAKYNPMAPLLDPKTPKNRHEAVARRIGDGCISGEATGRDSFFVNGGRDVWSTWVLAVARYGRPEDRNLPGVLRLMKSDFEGFCKRMIAKRDPDLSPRFKSYLREMERESRSFGDILQTVYVETSFLLDPAIAESLTESDFRFEWLGERVMTIAICLPLDLVEVNGKLCRLLVACCLGELLSPERSRRKKIVLFCDEAASYGPLECLVNAYSTARAFAVRIWTVWTDLGAMEELYPKRYLSLLANSGAQIWLGTKEPRSAEQISKQSGYRDVVTQSRSVCAVHGTPYAAKYRLIDGFWRYVECVREVKSLGNGIAVKGSSLAIDLNLIDHGDGEVCPWCGSGPKDIDGEPCINVHCGSCGNDVCLGRLQDGVFHCSDQCGNHGSKFGTSIGNAEGWVSTPSGGRSIASGSTPRLPPPTRLRLTAGG